MFTITKLYQNVHSSDKSIHCRCFCRLSKKLVPEMNFNRKLLSLCRSSCALSTTRQYFTDQQQKSYLSSPGKTFVMIMILSNTTINSGKVHIQRSYEEMMGYYMYIHINIS